MSNKHMIEGYKPSGTLGKKIVAKENLYFVK